MTNATNPFRRVFVFLFLKSFLFNPAQPQAGTEVTGATAPIGGKTVLNDASWRKASKTKRCALMTTVNGAPELRIK
jgi:hypothetical protein